MIDVVALTRRLVDIDSTTGREGEVARVLAGDLRALGYRVEEQVVAGDRINVFARLDADPVVVFSTHIDCVPPWFPSREEDGKLYGRGACDAKGIAAVQVAAAARLRASGESRVGLLFVAGEERGSDGARLANTTPPPGVRYLVDGEPTDSRLGLATRGAVRVRLSATGRAAHSAYPELGESAIDKLLDALNIIRGFDLPTDPVLGEGNYSIGLIAGGIAPNVISPTASAEIMFRTVTDNAGIHHALEAVRHLVSLETLLDLPPVRLGSAEGFTTAIFSFGTDIPMLTNWGTPLLLGPGSIHVAHTPHEHVAIDELLGSVDLYVSLARQLLSS
ncbi:MAG: M20/M25/M40 family metallo-hydrolase [Vicinamibacterales bacterium]